MKEEIVQIPTEMVKELREKTGAGVMECRNTLIEVEGNVDEASKLLQERGLAKVEKKAGRAANQGLIEVYVHPGGRIGAIIEVNCETDFVARTDEFKGLAHDLVLQVTATDPQYINSSEIEGIEDVKAEEACLLNQPFIKDPTKTISEIVNEVIAKVGENINIGRFERFELGK
jgi:elongation factor Ts